MHCLGLRPILRMFGFRGISIRGFRKAGSRENPVTRSDMCIYEWKVYDSVDVLGLRDCLKP